MEFYGRSIASMRPMIRSDTPAFGRIPDGATHWSVRREGIHAWQWCTFTDRQGVVQHEFLISDLDVSLIKRRWGPGRYRVMFLAIHGGARRVFGNGRVFELGPSQPRVTPSKGEKGTRGLEAVREEAGPSESFQPIVRSLLAAGQGQKNAGDLFHALAVPTGIGLGQLFEAQAAIAERLTAIERRLDALERDAAPRPPDASASGLDRVLAKLDAIETRLAPPRRRSPSR